MKNTFFILLLAVGVGIGIGAGYGTVQGLHTATDDQSTQAVSARIAENLGKRSVGGESDDLDPEQVALMVETLTQILSEEIAERQILAEQVEDLQVELAASQRNLRARVEAAFQMDTQSTTSQAQRTQVDQTLEGRLASAGFTLQEFESLRRRESGAQMRQVELDDQARREGWINTPRYFEASNNLTSGAESIRSELGDEAYDRYLFASGRPNRLVVSSVIPTSPAEVAGFKPGDIITSYGGEKVFSNEQLINLRSSGTKGSAVVVEIIRNGETMRVSIPRGPMGIQGGPRVVDPSEADR